MYTHNHAPSTSRAPRRVARILAALTLTLGAGLLGGSEASGQAAPILPDGGYLLPADPNLQPTNPELEAKAASGLAAALENKFKPGPQGEQMGGAGPSQIIVFEGTVDVRDTTYNRTLYKIHEPIVASTERPVGALGSGWIITQQNNPDGSVAFRPLHLSAFNTVITPAHPEDPNQYKDTYVAQAPAKGGPNAVAQSHVYACGPDGVIPPNAPMPGQEFNFADMK